MLLRICVLLGTLLAGVSISRAEDVPPGAVIYGVVPPLFGSDRPLRSVTARLPYLAALGVDIIWLSPLNVTDDPSQISYSVTDYFALRPDFGTPAELKKLVRKAHDLGMKVIIDFVPNHTSIEHPYFQDAARRGTESPFYDYYDRDRKGRPKYYFDWDYLPNLNYRNRAVRAMMTRALKYWLTEYDIDGFRLDVAWGIRRRAPGYFGQLERQLTTMRPGTILLAEAGARDPFYSRNKFDLAYDWTGRLGEWAWDAAFRDRRKTGEHLSKILARDSSGGKVLRFLNNNDTGKRFISRYGVAFLRVASVLQFTVPGAALLYTGDEVGAEYDPYEDAKPIAWSDPHGLRKHYQQLATLRDTIPAIRDGNLRLSKVSDPAAMAYFRTSSSGQWVLVVLNFGEAREIRIQVPPELRDSLEKVEKFRDLLSRRKVEFDPQAGWRSLEISMGDTEALLLVPD